MSMRLGNWVAVFAVATLAAQEPDGAALYRQHCRACHGAKGVPAERMTTFYPGLKTLADPAFLAKTSADSIAAVVRHGAGKFMRPFADKLSPAEMMAVAKFVKTLGGNAP